MRIAEKQTDQTKDRQNGSRMRKMIPLAAVCIMALIIFILVRQSGETLSVDTVLKYTPKNPVLAAVVLISFFALKSLTVVLPMSVLYLSSGILFPTSIAILVSTIGLAVTITVPYWIGRYSSDGIAGEIGDRYPKAGKIASYQQQNIFFACFIARIVGFLPCDIVSLYFGACKTPYPVYLLAGVCGSLLSVITTTLLGERLSDPFSPEFIAVLICRILVSAGSAGLNYKWNAHKNIG